MKRMRWYKNNKGSSLLFVIIAIAFVAILGTLLSQLTVINIQMKSTDKKAKETFYTNETALNELQITLEDISGEAMKKAYVGIVEDYANITNDSSRNLQDQFAYEYVRYLVNYFAGGGYDTSVIPEISDPADYADLVKDNNSAPLTYTAAISDIKSKMNSTFTASAEATEVSPSTWFKNDDTTANTLEYLIDNKSGGDSYVILRNIQVSYNTNEDGKKNDDAAVAHESTITTDIKLTVPKLSFQSGIYPKYTTYSIIANKYLNVNQNNISIDGDLYGSAGILVRGENAEFTGPKTTNIVTRGDFFVYQNGSLNIQGDSSSSSVALNDCVRIWANNFGTEKVSGSIGSTTTLTLTGDAFIQDDLILNANSSVVTLTGNNYYGFGYNRLNKSYTSMTAREKSSDMNSQYSSAITVNGKNVSLDMSGIINLKLAGRAYISRGQESTSMLSDTELGGYYSQSSTDIMTGEAVSFKSNQIAYLIPGEAINGGMNPMSAATYKKLVDNGEELVDTGKLRSVKSYLSSTPYTKYFYNLGGGSYVYFYYNFKNQNMANQYFADYFAGNESTIEKKLQSNGYINDSGEGVKLSSNVAFLSAACTGNILTATKNGDVTLVQPSSENNPDGDLTTLLEDAIKKAKEYYSMQLELSTEPSKYPISGSSVDGVEFRSVDGVKFSINGTIKDIPIYSEVVQGESQFDSEAATGDTYGFEIESGTSFKVKRVDVSAVDPSGKAAVYCIYPASGDETDTFTITNDFLKINGSMIKRGIILAACNIRMEADFEGMIITKGDVTLDTDNTSLTANTQLVQQILEYGGQSITDPKEKFTHYFFEVSSVGDTVAPTSVDISSYVSYSNWRNEEP